MQDEIAQAIASALRMKMAAKKASLRAYTPTLPAYDAFLRGRHLLFKFTPELVGPREGVARTGDRARCGVRRPAHGAGARVHPDWLQRH